MKILIIDVCKEKVSYFEFVKPIEQILKENKIQFFAKHCSDLKQKDIEKSEKIIICGTSLEDNEYLEHLEKFEFLKTTNKPILGICAGMQIIGLLFNCKLKKQSEIGLYEENFEKQFLTLKGKQKVYHLHKNYIEFDNKFEIFAISDSKIPQAVKHKNKEIYGVLFHPEVRQKQMIVEFCKN